MKLFFTIALLSFSILFTNCASIIHGSRQQVDFNSQPSHARIMVNDQYYGNTPKTLSLRRKGFGKNDVVRKSQYDIKIELPGYYPYELKLKRQMDGWVLGNILFGGIIGVVIDAASGSMYKLSPNQVIAQMAISGNSTSVTTKDQTIYVAITLTPDPSWEKVAVLEKK